MSKPETRFSMPADISRQDHIRTACIRMAYLAKSARANGVSDLLGYAKIPKTLDFPVTGERYSVWYAALRSSRNANMPYNPLWAIDYEVSLAFHQNRPINAWSIAKADRAAHYVAHGLATAHHASDRAYATVGTLAERIDILEHTHGLVPEAAIEELSSTVALDPVIELLWRDSRKIAVKDTLVVRARLAVAEHPAVYMHKTFPRDRMQARRLGTIFEVNNDGKGELVRSPAVDGLFDTEQAVMEAF